MFELVCGIVRVSFCLVRIYDSAVLSVQNCCVRFCHGTESFRATRPVFKRTETAVIQSCLKHQNTIIHELSADISWFDSQHFQIFWEAVGLEQGPLSLVSITEELGRNSSGSGQENQEYDWGDPLRWPRNTLYPQKLILLRQEAAVAQPVGIVR
jgi:hypothetical protein